MPTVPNQISAVGTESSIASNMTSRFLGLVVVPGHYIGKIEVEGPVENVEQKISGPENKSPIREA